MVRSTIRLLSVVASGAFALAAAGCMKGPETPAETNSTQTTSASTTTTTDFTIGDTFGALRALHMAEVGHGTTAMARASDPKVKAYAEKVVNDHKARMKKDDKLMQSLGISPRENAVSEHIKSVADAQGSRLDALSGPEFDRAYLDDQISYYRTALDTFDKELLPAARDPKVRQQILDARSKANDHLREAQDLRLSLIDR
jgi:putative membrane protein